MYEPFELPSLEEIEQMEQLRSQAIQALEISDNMDKVKCQRCSSAVLIVGKLDRPHNDRAVILQKRIKWLEDHQHHRYFAKSDILNALKQELAELLEEDAKADKLRSLPLYSCKITGWKFVCSRCYDRLSLRVR